MGYGVSGKLQKNPNKEVPEKKILYTSTSYKSEYTIVKIKNKELQDVYDELIGHLRIISRAPKSAADAIEEYGTLMEKMETLTKVIEDANGMPLPIPKKLKELHKKMKGLPKPKVVA